MIPEELDVEDPAFAHRGRPSAPYSPEGRGHRARDVEAFIALSDPQVEFHSIYEEVGGSEYHGHDGTRRFFSDLADTWEEIRIEPEAYYDLGETTLLYYLARARGRQSGAEVTMPLAQVCRWRDGLCFHWRTYVHRGDALTDLGVSTEALEPIAP